MVVLVQLVEMLVDVEDPWSYISILLVDELNQLIVHPIERIIGTLYRVIYLICYCIFYSIQMFLLDIRQASMRVKKDLLILLNPLLCYFQWLTTERSCVYEVKSTYSIKISSSSRD